MTKIAFIGAGSTVFAKNLRGDILSFPELAESTAVKPWMAQTMPSACSRLGDTNRAR